MHPTRYFVAALACVATTLVTTDAALAADHYGEAASSRVNLGVTVNDTTSCSFAERAVRAMQARPYAKTLRVYSPVTKKVYILKVHQSRSSDPYDPTRIYNTASRIKITVNS